MGLTIIAGDDVAGKRRRAPLGRAKAAGFRQHAKPPQENLVGRAAARGKEWLGTFRS